MITGRPIGAGGGGGRRHQFGGGRGRPLDGRGRPDDGAEPAQTESGGGSGGIGGGRPHQSQFGGGADPARTKSKEFKRLNGDVGTSVAYLLGSYPTSLFILLELRHLLPSGVVFPLSSGSICGRAGLGRRYARVG